MSYKKNPESSALTGPLLRASDRTLKGGSWAGFNLLKHQVSYHLEVANHTNREKEGNSQAYPAVVEVDPTEFSGGGRRFVRTGERSDDYKDDDSRMGI